ncbi:unnamed protein product [Ranitomeya imitator]|uniref:S-adenosylmethionine synthase n=1 Tax=Ranitomeya imitator TaxID=111125 RepID=A0ABN9M7I8_9NEOB|nr:unnamed protein product [Ranitomeya imitator]
MEIRGLRRQFVKARGLLHHRTPPRVVAGFLQQLSGTLLHCLSSRAPASRKAQWCRHRSAFRLTGADSAEESRAPEDRQLKVTVKYIQQNGAVIPVRVHTIVISVQHDETVSLCDMQEALKNKVIKAVVPDKYLDEKTIYHLQPSGRFVIGGPQGDAGVTGRKIIVDTYGGWGAHGGGAFSGKDYTKVDRSAAYAARWVAKSLVHSKLCHRVLVQVSYAIGVAQPLSVSLFTYGTSEKTEKELLDIVNKNFDLRPGVIVRDLDLKKPLYQNTACYGHFGREGFSWEVPKELIF